MVNLTKQCKGGTFHLVKIPQEYKVQVAKTIEKAFNEACKLFAYQKPVEAAIFPKISTLIIPELGIGATTSNQGYIVITIDFSRHNIKKIINEQLPSTVYHEFSHIVRGTYDYENYGVTLLEALVAEGIASYVENKIFKNIVPYTKPIKNEKEYWLKAQKNMNEKIFDQNEWFFGMGELPLWIGYRLGYLMVDSFMKQKKNLSMAQLIRTKSHEILKSFSLPK